MISKYALGSRHDSSKYHNQSHDVNSRNSAKQVNAYIANKILGTKQKDNKSHATSVSTAKDTKRMNKLVFMGEQRSNKPITDKVRPQLKNSCESVRKSQKRSAKARYLDKSNTSKMSESKKGTSKKKKKPNFNNTTKLSSHYMNVPGDQFMQSMAPNSKYTMSINTNRHANVSINIPSNNRSGAKCHMLSKISTPKTNAVGRRYKGMDGSGPKIISPPSSTKNSEPRAHFFNFPGTTKARKKGMNTSEIISSMATGPAFKNNFSNLSYNSSASKLGMKEKKNKKKKSKLSTSNNRASERGGDDANREIMK